MRICVVHNEYGKFSGEEAAVRVLCSLLKQHGHKVIPFVRSSAEIGELSFGKARAFFSGIYSFWSRTQAVRLLQESKPHVVHVHNVFPLLSPSVLAVCRQAGLPVVMTVHNYRLICPNGLFMTDGQICRKCAKGREYWCVLYNCEKSLLKSIGYALRNYVARYRRMFLNNVTLYACLTEFQRQQLVRAGFPAQRCLVVPNMADLPAIQPSRQSGQYVGYVGRISPEKGMQTLVESARACSDIQFKAAGSYDRMAHLPGQAPRNFEFCGHLNKDQLGRFYANSRYVVLCTICYEGFPSVLPEAMLSAKPVICSRIGGLAEIVDDNVNGLLFEPNNSKDLVEKIRFLWERPALCRRMGQAGRQKALREYSPEKYYERLMAVYEKALKLGPGGQN